MNVLFITAWYPGPERPFEGVFVREHARAAAARHDVVVLHCGDPDSGEPGRSAPLLGQVTRVEGPGPGAVPEIPLYRMDRRRPRVRGIGLPASALAAWRAVGAIRRSGFRPDLIHAHVFTAGAPAVIVARLLGLPLVVTEHFSAIPRGHLTADERRNARFAFRHADVVLPVSQSLRDAIVQLEPSARCEVVPNVVDTGLFRPPAVRRGSRPGDPARLLTVGMMVPTHVKGVPVLLEALARLSCAAGPWRLDIVGDGPARGEYERRAAELGLASRVRFHGAQPKEGVAAFMQAADLFVLASSWETFGCVIAEAMASGLPVVATEAGAIPELVGRGDGLLVPPGDAPALAAALAGALAMRDDFDREAIARRAQRFAPDRVAEAIDAIYRRLVTG